MNITQQVVILSAELQTLSYEQNSRRTDLLDQMIGDTKMSYKKALGVYNTSEEACFVVIVNNQDEIDTLKAFADNFGQESILHQDANQQAQLIFNSGKTMDLGRLEQVNPKEIENLENYTVLDGKVYTTISR